MVCSTRTVNVETHTFLPCSARGITVPIRRQRHSIGGSTHTVHTTRKNDMAQQTIPPAANMHCHNEDDRRLATTAATESNGFKRELTHATKPTGKNMRLAGWLTPLVAECFASRASSRLDSKHRVGLDVKRLMPKSCQISASKPSSPTVRTAVRSLQVERDVMATHRVQKRE